MSLQLKAEENPILIKSNQREFAIDIKTSVAHWGSGNSETNLFLGMLISNTYQESSYSRIDEKGNKMNFGYSGDTCVYYNIKLGSQMEAGKSVHLLHQYQLSVYDIYTDFDLIDTIYPYNPVGYNSFKYTKSKKPYIDVENQEMILVADSIWNKSEDALDYAENCYNYVVENFTYQNPLTGFHPLSKILKNKGADCGNLSSVFITLLRIKKVPARHLMGFRPDGTLHVWADFYLENYGWIPVDVTYQIERPYDDFFGNIKFQQNGFIINRGISNIVVYDDKVRKINGLQTYSCDINYSKTNKAKVYIDRKIKCVNLNHSASIGY